MPAGKQTKRWIGVLLLVGIVALAVALYPRPRLLLTRATRIVPIDRPSEPCFWLSNHEALLLHLVSYNDTKKNSAYYSEALVVDVYQRTVSPLQSLNARMGRSEIDLDAGLSPDRKWLAATPYPESTYGVQAVTLNGKQSLFWPDKTLATSIGHLQWMLDSRQCIRVTGKITFPNAGLSVPTDAFIYSLDSPQSSRRVSLPGLPPNTYPVGTLPNGHLLLYTSLGWRGPRGTLSLFDCTLNAPNATIQTIPVPMPNINAFFPPVLSPQGDKLAWFVIKTHPPSGSWLWQRLQTWFGIGAHGQNGEMGIWVSDLQGKHWSEVGHLDPQQQNTWPNEWPMAWLPDGKRLSFLYQGALWTVPID